MQSPVELTIVARRMVEIFDDLVVKRLFLDRCRRWRPCIWTGTRYANFGLEAASILLKHLSKRGLPLLGDIGLIVELGPVKMFN